MAERTSIVQRWGEYRPSKSALFWSCLLCIGLTMALGFTWGGWVTHGTAIKMTGDAVASARTDLAASVCVHRFLGAKDAASKLNSLKMIAAWKRAQVIEDGGWSVMPGLQNEVGNVAGACAQRLAEMQPPQSDQASDTGAASGKKETTTVQ